MVAYRILFFLISCSNLKNENSFIFFPKVYTYITKKNEKNSKLFKGKQSGILKFIKNSKDISWWENMIWKFATFVYANEFMEKNK